MKQLARLKIIVLVMIATIVILAQGGMDTVLLAHITYLAT